MTPEDKQLIEDIFENDEPMGEVDTPLNPYEAVTLDGYSYAFILAVVQELASAGFINTPSEDSFLAPPESVTLTYH